MRKRSLFTLLLSVLGMTVLILDGKTACQGIRSGIEICLGTLIPSLFPFFVLSILITSAISPEDSRWLRPIGRICRIPQGSESLLIIGILGGYPVGAGNVYQSVKQGALRHEDAQRMAVFCNNPGPSFIFGILGTMFPDKRWIFLIWFIQIASAVLTGILLPAGNGVSSFHIQSSPASFTKSLKQALNNMAAVCGWVVLFRMILEFLNRWVFWLFPKEVQIMTAGILELSNGCLGLDQIDAVEIRFLIASAMLSSGGLCVLMQTVAVFPGLDLKRYLSGKLIQCGTSMILACAVVIIYSHQFILPSVISVLAAVSVNISLATLRKTKKEVAFL